MDSNVFRIINEEPDLFGKNLMISIMPDRICGKYPFSVGILIPTIRKESMLTSLISLSNSSFSSIMELIIVVDNDKEEYDYLAKSFLLNSNLNKNFLSVKMIFSSKRLYSVAAFNEAYKNCESYFFCWMNDENTYEHSWLIKSLNNFSKTFSDGVGVLTLCGKKKKSSLGLSTKDFVRYNKGEWFYPGYKMNYCDDELACRAMLLGRYSYLGDSGVHHNSKITEAFTGYNSDEEKIGFKKADRSVFYKRSETNFDLPVNRIYPWNSKTNYHITYPLKEKDFFLDE